MTAYGGVHVEIHAILISALDVDKRLAIHPGHVPQWGRLGYQLDIGLGGPHGLY